MGIQKKLKIDPNITAAARVEAETEDEIDQIMSEIEQLQQKMDDAPNATKSSAPTKLKVVQKGPSHEENEEDESSVLSEFRGSGEEPSMEETLSDLKDDGPREPSLLDQAITASQSEAEPESEIETEIIEEDTEYEDPNEGDEDMSHNDDYEGQSPKDGCLTMTLNGSMTLKLRYEFDGQEVTLGFTNQALRVQLSDGTEFKVPIRQKSLRRAA